ncbi:MAG: VCBS repeat-containing protein, partial [Candidatus Omnitrophica bacterium]|nr:VCBS repeat-containing protein [Candidatus Omnitrophota bacterium]
MKNRSVPNLFFALLIFASTSTFSFADITTDSFKAWSRPIVSAGKENFQHDQFTGSARYSIPLEVAPGTDGIQPEVVLRYLSGAGNSSVGQGWSIDLGVITRSTRLGKPNFNDNDILVLQLNDLGSELVNIGGGQYRTKIETHLRITKSGSSWLVEDRDGTRYEYNFQLGELNYYLTRIIDTHGNYVEITYTSSDFVGYIDRITYTKGNGLIHFRTVEFFYESRTDDYTDNSTGRTVKYNQRANYVDIKADGALYKRYDLTYTDAPNSGKSLLTQVDEIGKDGSSRLMVAQFSYLNNAVSLSPSPSPISNPPPWDISNDPYTRIGDVNGDGYPDLFRLQFGTIQISLGQSGGWGPVLENGFNHFGFESSGPNLRLGDVNGDGKDDIIKSSKTTPPNTADYYVAYNNGSSFGNGLGWDAPVFISNTGSWVHERSLIFQTTHLANVNGDKYVDLVSARQQNQNDTTTTYYVAYGNGSGWNDWVATGALPLNFILAPQVYGFPGNQTGSNSILADVNGDGLEDIVSSAQNTVTGFHFYYVLNNGTSWDGVIKEVSDSTPEFFDLRFASTHIFDVNRDGFPDLFGGRFGIVGQPSTLVYKYVLGNGKGFGGEQTLSSFPPWSTGDRGVLITDVNRDGIADILNTLAGQFSATTLNFPQGELLKEITTRYGGKITFTYQSPIQTGNTTFPFSLAVLASTTFDPGVASAAPAGTYHYIYNNGLYDIQNKLFKGFQHVQTTDPLSFIHHTYFHQTDSKLGKVERQENSITRFSNTYQDDGAAPYFTPLIQSDECTDSKCGRTSYQYDEHGNIIKSIHYGDLDTMGDEKTIVTEYVKNTSLWIVNLPARETFFANIDGSGTFLAENQYFYDNN